jgi:hypothetical protein
MYCRTVYLVPCSQYGKLSSSECHLYITQVYCNFIGSICYISKKINVCYEQNFLYVWFSGSGTVKINIKHIEDCIVIQVLSHTHTHTHKQTTHTGQQMLAQCTIQTKFLFDISLHLLTLLLLLQTILLTITSHKLLSFVLYSILFTILMSVAKLKKSRGEYYQID